jgi:hypothetical protein
MVQQTAQRKLPKFVNVHDLKETPEDPVIPFFTKVQWDNLISRQRLRKRSVLPLSEFQVRYHLAPWGGGDVMIYPNPAFAGYLRFECEPLFKVIVQTDPLEMRLIYLGFLCRLKHCIPYIEYYVGEIPKGANGIGCDDEQCRGGCREIWVGTQTDGHLTCQCLG